MNWVTRSRWIDIDTGEVIPESRRKDFIKLKTTKNATSNRTTERGIIEYTVECRAREYRQGELFGEQAAD